MATQISIHAPAKGATRGTCAKDTFSANFNPRSREGSDAIWLVLARGIRKISIHAPAKGATWTHKEMGGGADDFNPRSREGSDMSPFLPCSA